MDNNTAEPLKIFVTGGSRGIGQAVVRKFAQNPDHKIVFTYNQRHDLANELIESLNSDNIRHTQMNLQDQTSIENALEQAMGYFDGFDVVVHNAGFAVDGPFFFMEKPQWDNVIQAATNSFFFINQKVLPSMISNRSGRIIVIASTSGESGNRGQVNYSAAKGAMIAASKSLAKEVGRKGVLVNVVSPGLIESDMTSDIPFERVKDMIPLGRYGKPEEVANAVHFLASAEASYICGAVLRVNGGIYT